MKHITKYYLGALMAILVGINGCTGDFDKINTDPNNMNREDVLARNFLTPIIFDGSKRWSEYTWFWNNQLMQYAGFTGNTRPEHRYVIGDQNFTAWINFLAENAYNANELRISSLEEGYELLSAVGGTLEAFYMSNITDMFGDMPYSEAFQGRNDNFTPVYDTQEEIYRQLFALLEENNRIYSEHTSFLSSVSRFDGLFNGDVMLWRKFNNSLYLRMLMRVSGRSASTLNPHAKIKEIYEDAEGKYPVISSNADNAIQNYIGNEPYMNHFYKTTENEFTNERRVAAQLIKMTVLKDAADQDFEDPRLRIWCRTDGNSNPWKGVISGELAGDPAFDASKTNASKFNHTVFCRSTMPYWHMDYAEIEFIYAEAALKGIIPGGPAMAKECYEKAIRASIEKWGSLAEYTPDPTKVNLEESNIVAFLNLPDVAFDDTAPRTDLEELIADQKYLALFWCGMEAWHEYRRTGYPELVIGKGANQKILPTRFQYTQVAIGSNPVNAGKAIARIKGENNMEQPVWWSKLAIDEGYFVD